MEPGNVNLNKDEKTKRKKYILQNSVRVCFCSYGLPPSEEAIKKWLVFSEITAPSDMYITANNRTKSLRFKTDKLEKAIDENKFLSFSLTNLDNVYDISVRIYAHSSCFCADIPLDYFTGHQAEIEKLFTELNCCFGYVDNLFDTLWVQNGMFLDIENLYNITEEDCDEIRDVKPLPGYDEQKYLDKSNMPGYVQEYVALRFTSAPIMYIGNDFYRFFDKDVVMKFSDCEDNLMINDTTRRIVLTNDLLKYNDPSFRRRQRSFRSTLNINEIIDGYIRNPMVYKNAESEMIAKSSLSIEISRGNFEHGGTLLVRAYVNKRNNSCEKSKAYAYIETEFADDGMVWQKKFKINTK